MTQVNENAAGPAAMMEQYQKIWSQALEQYQKVMSTGQSYMKPWTDFLEQYQKMMGSFFPPRTDSQQGG